MKARTLPAFDAALVAFGVKTIIVTDSPVPPALIGQTVAIHADDQSVVNRMELGDWEAWPADTADRPHPNHPNGRPARLYCNTRPVTLSIAQWYVLPSNEIVATATIAACVPIIAWRDANNSVGREVNTGTGWAHPVPPSADALRLPKHRLKIDQDPHQRLRYDTREVTTDARLELQMDGLCTNFEDQMPYGDFAPGRWAVLLDDVTATRQPALAQGPDWWDWNP